MSKGLLLFFSTMLLVSCVKDKSIAVTQINGFPPDIMGCSCYYAVDEAHFQKQQFIYIDSYETTPAYISINDFLIAVDPKNEQNSKYTLDLEIEEEIQLDQERYHREGTLIITDKNGAVYSTSIYGECGC